MRKGARLMRRMTADEIRQKQDAVRFATKGNRKKIRVSLIFFGSGSDLLCRY